MMNSGVRMDGASLKQAPVMTKMTVSTTVMSWSRVVSSRVEGGGAII